MRLVFIRTLFLAWDNALSRWWLMNHWMNKQMKEKKLKRKKSRSPGIPEKKGFHKRRHRLMVKILAFGDTVLVAGARVTCPHV